MEPVLRRFHLVVFSSSPLRELVSEIKELLKEIRKTVRGIICTQNIQKIVYYLKGRLRGASKVFLPLVDNHKILTLKPQTNLCSFYQEQPFVIFLGPRQKWPTRCNATSKRKGKCPLI